METRRRNQNLVIRLLDEERAELDALAAAERATASDIVRRLVRNAYVDRFGNKRAPRAKKG